MRRRGELFGRCWPVETWVHRIPAGRKAMLLAVLSALVVILRSPLAAGALIVLLLVAAVSARIPLGVLLAPLRRLLLIVALIAGFHLVAGDPHAALRVAATMAACVLAAALLMLTTRLEELLAVFTAAAAPLRLLGVSPDRVGLAALLVVRSLPHLADLAAVTGDAARARGLERSVRARTTPLVLGAVRYAEDTGRALHARGLAD